MTLPSQEDELKQALIRIAKRKGHYDKSFTNYLVTVEELLPEVSALIAKARIEAREQEGDFIMDALGDFDDDEFTTKGYDRLNQIISRRYRRLEAGLKDGDE